MKKTDFPIATVLIVAINSIIFLFTHGAKEFSYRFGVVISDFSISDFLTYAFIHDSIWHLVINMIIFALFAIPVEKKAKSFHLIMLYVLSAIVSASFYSLIVEGAMPPYYCDLALTGASGCVMAVMAFYVMTHKKTIKVASLTFSVNGAVFGWFFYQLLCALLSLSIDSIGDMALRTVAYWNHIGGFFFGSIYAGLSKRSLK